MKITTIAILIMSTLCAFAEGEPFPPCWPDCPTNPVPYDPPTYTPPVYTNGELVARVVSIVGNVVQIGLTNVDPFKEYAVQRSFDLITWTTVTRTNVSAVNEHFFSITNTPGERAFFRAWDVTDPNDLIAYPTYGAAQEASPSSCPGHYVGYYVYRPVNNVAPFEPIPGYTNRMLIDPTGSTSTRFDTVGRYGGDQYCGASPLHLPNVLDDPRIGVSLFFKVSFASTNYPIIARGFQPMTELDAMVDFMLNDDALDDMPLPR